MAVDRLVSRSQLVETLREQAKSSAAIGELALTIIQALLAEADLPHHTQAFGERMKLTRAVERVAALQKGTQDGMQALALLLQGMGLVSAEEQTESELRPLNESELVALYKYLIQVVRALEPKLEAIMAEVSNDPVVVLELGKQLLEPREVSELELSELFTLLLGGE